MHVIMPKRALLPLALLLLAACATDGFTPADTSGSSAVADTFVTTTALGPTEVTEAQMAALQVAPTAPAPAADEVSFYAKKGEDRDVSLVFADIAGAPAFDEHGNNGHGHAYGHWHHHGFGSGPDTTASDTTSGQTGAPGDSTAADSSGAGGGAGTVGTPLSHEYARLTVWKNSLLAYPDGRPIADGDSVLITVRLVDRSRMLLEFEPAGLTFSAATPAELQMNYGLSGGDLNHDGVVDSVDAELEGHLGIWHQTAAGAVFDRLTSAIARSTGAIRSSIPGFSRYAVSY